jgi:hypothetical protein
MFGGEFSFAAVTSDEGVAAVQSALRRVATALGRRPIGSQRD